MFGLGPLANLIVNIIANSRQFQTQIGLVHGQLIRVQSFGRRFGNFFAMTGAILALKQYVSLVERLETNFIRIERVSGALRGPKFRGEIFDLAQNISGAGIEDIQKIMKISAQLGIRGKDNLMEFTKQMAMLSSITGLSAEQMATDVGKIIQVFNLLPTDAERVSNTILQAADDFNVLESEITNIVRRIGSFSDSIGLSLAETVGFAAAMKDVGVNTEIAASSLYSFFARLQTQPVAIAKFFGMANEEIFEFFKVLRQNPTQGIILLLERIKRMPPSQRLTFFKELELYGVRNAAALGTLAEKVDRLKAAIASANQGASENIKLMGGQYDVTRSLRGGIDNLTDAWKRFLFEFTNTAHVSGFFNFLSDNLDALAFQLREIRGLTFSNVDPSRPESIRKRISEIDKEQNQIDMRDDPGWKQLKSLGGLDFGNFIDNFLKAKADRLGFERLTRERISLFNLLERLEERKKVEDERKRPGEGAIRNEFQWLLDQEKKKKKEKTHFEGFMGLEEAWKNFLLDKIEGKNKEFKKLEDIHDEAIEQNEHLEEAVAAIKNIRVGAILG